MFKITFKYIDQYSNGEWRTQSGVYSSVKKCIEWNGLEVDCIDYEIISVEQISE